MTSTKTYRAWNEDEMRRAVRAVDQGMSIRSAAELYGIPRSTLTTYVANELRLEDEMKFMENFDPEKSKREQRKLNRKISNVVYDEKSLPLKTQPSLCRSYKRVTLDDRGVHTKTGLDLCDCLYDRCPGCFFPCPKCRSNKCGHECRQGRRWMYESYQIQGTEEVYSNQYLDH